MSYSHNNGGGGYRGNHGYKGGQGKPRGNRNGGSHQGPGRRFQASPVPFQSKNLSWAYYAEYYQDRAGNWLSNNSDGNVIEGRNLGLLTCGSGLHSDLAAAVSHDEPLSGVPGYGSFRLKTAYQGLLMGTGYLHAHGSEDGSDNNNASGASAFKGEIGMGFSFDYPSGLPYLPGSSVKGSIRSVFPWGDSESKDPMFLNKCGIVGALLVETFGRDSMSQATAASNVNDIGAKDIVELRNALFDNGVTFLDAFPYLPPCDEIRGGLLATDYITPHHRGNKDVFGNPMPIQILKVRAGVQFEFRFILPDRVELSSGVLLDHDDLLAFLRTTIMFVGVGAKTSTGYGRLIQP
ncbi:MAG: type III-B CRISPR module RAMP protein Cmr6 [Atopobiaceae bacterium]